MTRKLLIGAILLLTSSQAAWSDSCLWSDDRYQCEYRKWERRREYQRWIARQDYYAGLRTERRRERRWEERREHERCKPPIHVVGEADHLKDSAKRSAIHVWQNIVVHELGERWMDYDSAEIIDEHYDVAGHGGDVLTNVKRFVITARPCLRRSNTDGGPEEAK